MGENGRKALSMAAILAATLIIIGIGFAIISSTTGASQEAINDSNQKINAMIEADYEQYNEENVYGSDVYSKIREEKTSGGELIIRVTTNSSTTDYISTGSVTGTTLSGALTATTNVIAMQTAAKDENDNAYINPQASFSASLIYDANDSIRGILFVQQ